VGDMDHMVAEENLASLSPLSVSDPEATIRVPSATGLRNIRRSAVPNRWELYI
jgi:hypothetical protein